MTMQNHARNVWEARSMRDPARIVWGQPPPAVRRAKLDRFSPAQKSNRAAERRPVIFERSPSASEASRETCFSRLAPRNPTSNSDAQLSPLNHSRSTGHSSFPLAACSTLPHTHSRSQIFSTPRTSVRPGVENESPTAHQARHC